MCLYEKVCVCVCECVLSVDLLRAIEKFQMWTQNRRHLAFRVESKIRFEEQVEATNGIVA